MRDDHVVVGSVEFAQEGRETSAHVEVGFPARVSERELVSAAVEELSRVRGFKLSVGEVVKQTGAELV